MISLLRRYHPTIWVRVLGTVLSKTCEFMLRAYLGIYIYEKMGQDLSASALAVTAGPLVALIIGFVGGAWSDRLGRKPVMLAAVVIQAVSVLGFLGAHEYWQFVFCSMLSGLGNALYWPAANAQVADLVEERLRGEVFALMHTAINVGAAFGPLIGVVLIRHHPQWAFLISASGLLTYGAILLFFTVESAPLRVRETTKEEASLSLHTRPWQEWLPIFLITIAAIPVGLIYSQGELILPQQFKTRFSDYLSIYGTMIAFNGTSVAILQLPIQKWAERFRPARVILVAYLFMSITAIGYGFAKSLPLLLMVEFLFTLGEMLNGPQLQRVVAHIAPEKLRGRYFAILAMSWGIAGVLGPNLAAWSIGYLGGGGWFLVLAGTLSAAGVFQFALVTRAMK